LALLIGGALSATSTAHQASSDSEYRPGCIEPYVPYVDPARYQVRAFESLSAKPVAWYRKSHFDYLIFSGENFDDNTQAADYYALFSQ